MDAWLKTHAALILPIAGALYLAGGDTLHLADDCTAPAWMARGWKQSLHVLQTRHIPILPGAVRIYAWIPAMILILPFQRLLIGPILQAAFSHADHIRLEMHQLVAEFSTLAQPASLPTPALCHLFTAINPA